MASLYPWLTTAAHTLSATVQRMFCMTRDRPQNHFPANGYGFIAALCACSSLVMNILINTHALFAVNSNYPFLINE